VRQPRPTRIGGIEVDGVGLDARTETEQSTVVEAVVLTFTRPETTSAVTRGVARLFAALGYAPLLEVGLPNGRRADIMALGPRGQIAIAEVKSSIEDFRTDRKWGEYMPYCDTFYFAVAPEFPRHILPEEPGLIVADAFDGAVLRQGPITPLVGARRKALTVAFGRLAAVRATVI
jgi:hypothetical protein